MRLIDWQPSPGDPSVPHQFYLIAVRGVPEFLRYARYWLLTPVRDLRNWFVFSVIYAGATWQVSPEALAAVERVKKQAASKITRRSASTVSDDNQPVPDEVGR